MTRKHFEQAADIVRKLNAPASHKKTVCAAFAALFVIYNPRFDVGRFTRACGL